MTTRRQFIGTALSAAALTGSIAATAADLRAPARSPLRSALRIHLAIVDSRFAAAHAFGRAMRSRGVRVASFGGDITPIWYYQLDPAWRQRPLVVAGLTTDAVLFCLEQFAWDHGMRVAYRGEHRISADGGVDHILESPSTRPQDVRTELSGLTPWPAQVADLIAGIDEPQPAFPSEADARSRSVRKTRSRPTSEPARLVSWLIAPKRPSVSAGARC